MIGRVTIDKPPISSTATLRPSGDCYEHAPSKRRVELESEHKAKSRFHFAHRCGRYSAHALHKKGLVCCDELRDVDDRLTGKLALAAPQQNISRRGCELQIRGNDGAQDRSNGAFVEFVRLNHQHGTPESRPGARRDRQSRPPDLSPPSYHFRRATDFDCSASTSGSSAELSGSAE